MASPRADVGIGRVRITTRSILVLIGLLGLGLGARNVIGKSTRVLGWLLAATIVAALLHPPVAWLARRMHRSLALLIVIVGVVVPVGVMTYQAWDQVRTEATRLQRALPVAAAELEASERWGEAAREFELRDHVEEFVDELPERISGGTTAAVLRSTATRGVAFLAAGVLTLFLLSYGPRLLAGGLAQVAEPQRERVAHIVGRAYQRAWGYAVGSIAMGVLAGLVAYIACRWAELPGSVLLALVVGVFSVVPNVGVVVGSLPALLLAVGFYPGTATPLVLLLVFVGFQLFETLVPQRFVYRHTVQLGPVIPVVVALIGFDLSGLGGAVCGLALTAFAAAVADEWAPKGDGAEPVAFEPHAQGAHLHANG